ncbi:MAG: hypothetical protein WC436_01150 [Candidatus Babeliales bacterium]
MKNINFIKKITIFLLFLLINQFCYAGGGCSKSLPPIDNKLIDLIALENHVNIDLSPNIIGETVAGVIDFFTENFSPNTVFCLNGDTHNPYAPRFLKGINFISSGQNINVTDASLGIISDVCKNLEYINLAKCPRISHFGVLSLIQKCENLKEIILPIFFISKDINDEITESVVINDTSRERIGINGIIRSMIVGAAEMSITNGMVVDMIINLLKALVNENLRDYKKNLKCIKIYVQPIISSQNLAQRQRNANQRLYCNSQQLKERVAKEKRDKDNLIKNLSRNINSFVTQKIRQDQASLQDQPLLNCVQRLNEGRYPQNRLNIFINDREFRYK